MAHSSPCGQSSPSRSTLENASFRMSSASCSAELISGVSSVICLLLVVYELGVAVPEQHLTRLAHSTCPLGHVVLPDGKACTLQCGERILEPELQAFLRVYTADLLGVNAPKVVVPEGSRLVVVAVHRPTHSLLGLVRKI